MLVLSTNQYTVVIMEKHCQTEVCIAACTAGRRVQQFCKSTMEVKKKTPTKNTFYTYTENLCQYQLQTEISREQFYLLISYADGHCTCI